MPTPPLPHPAHRTHVGRVIAAVLVALAIAAAPLAAADQGTPLATPCADRADYQPGGC